MRLTLYNSLDKTSWPTASWDVTSRCRPRCRLSKTSSAILIRLRRLISRPNGEPTFKTRKTLKMRYAILKRVVFSHLSTVFVGCLILRQQNKKVGWVQAESIKQTAVRLCCTGRQVLFIFDSHIFRIWQIIWNEAFCWPFISVTTTAGFCNPASEHKAAAHINGRHRVISRRRWRVVNR